MQEYKVALTACENYERQNVRQALLRQFELLGGVGKFILPGETVLLKPNFIAAKTTEKPAQTHPAIICEIARIVKEAGASPLLGDSPAWNDINTCINALGIKDELENIGVETVKFGRGKNVPIDGGSINICQTALSVDKIINLPKLKSHQQLWASFAIKNMFGIVPGKLKAFLHFSRGGDESRFCRMLIDIYRACPPAVNIIDGVVAMQGPGPINGYPKELGFIVGGVDPVACELVCCKVLDCDPAKLPIIRTAGQMEFGCPDLESIDILGDRIENLKCTDFLWAEQIPIKFSLIRVCRSISRQVILLLKNRPKTTRTKKG